jgi:hypothetical protein
MPTIPATFGFTAATYPEHRGGVTPPKKSSALKLHTPRGS